METSISQLYEDIAGVVAPWVEQIAIPFAGKRSRFTSRVEGAVMTWLHDSPIEGWERLIAFDRFHAAKHFTEGVDKARKREHAVFMKGQGESPLTKSGFDWLVNSDRRDNLSGKRKRFLRPSLSRLKTVRAWKIKETASMLWDYVYMKAAEEGWKKPLRWISQCRIPEMIAAGKTVGNYFWGILNAIRLRATNGALEATNGCIQGIKRMAYGFRNKERFKTAILFHPGNLNMDPSTI
jgi:transposase